MFIRNNTEINTQHSANFGLSSHLNPACFQGIMVSPSMTVAETLQLFHILDRPAQQQILKILAEWFKLPRKYQLVCLPSTPFRQTPQVAEGLTGIQLSLNLTQM
jgi:hypothetical protein